MLPTGLNYGVFIIKTLPDVLFPDLNMPVKNGIECLQLLREDRKFDSVPIIIYSTGVSKNDIDKAYRIGANYFIVKPNTIEDIAGMIKKFVLWARKFYNQFRQEKSLLLFSRRSC